MNPNRVTLTNYNNPKAVEKSHEIAQKEGFGSEERKRRAATTSRAAAT